MSVVGAMVARESLRKRAASQSIQGSQPIKRNTIAQPVHVGLRIVLARCPPPQPEDVEEEEEEEEEEVAEEEVELELQESDEDLDEEDDEDENAELVDPTIEREPCEPLEEEEGFRTASGRMVRPTRGATEALAAARVAQSAKATKVSKSNRRTQKPARRSSQNSSNLKSTSRKKPKAAKPSRPPPRRKNTPDQVISVDSSLLTPSEPDIVWIYYMAI